MVAAYIVREMINNSATAELMDENLLLRSQVQDLDIDLIELKTSGTSSMYAAQAEMSTWTMGIRLALSRWN